jgi:hypothetical protein
MKAHRSDRQLNLSSSIRAIFVFSFVCIPYGAEAADQKTERIEAMKNMQRIVERLHMHRVGGRGFPEDGTKKNTISWRCFVVPRNPMFSGYPDLPWKSPHNQIAERLFVDSDENRKWFAVRNRSKPSKFAQIFAITGPGTAFTEYAESTGRDSNLAEPDAILLMDCENYVIHWMEPGDIEVGPLLSHMTTLQDDLIPNLPGGYLVAFVDGAVWWISHMVPTLAIRPFYTLEGAKTHNRDDELAKYVLDKLPPLEKFQQRNFYPPKKSDEK